MTCKSKQSSGVSVCKTKARIVYQRKFILVLFRQSSCQLCNMEDYYQEKGNPNPSSLFETILILTVFVF